MKLTRRRTYKELLTKSASLLTSKDREFSLVCRLLLLILAMALRDDGWTKQRMAEDFAELIDAVFKDE